VLRCRRRACPLLQLPLLLHHAHAAAVAVTVACWRPCRAEHRRSCSGRRRLCSDWRRHPLLLSRVRRRPTPARVCPCWCCWCCC
jgi:hypothetical protein